VGKYFLVCALALLALPATAVAGYYEIAADADSYLKEAAPLETHGSDLDLFNKWKAGDNLQSVWRFDLSSIQAGETVVSAVAVFFVSKNNNEPVAVYRITNTWTESAANWNNLGNSYEAGTRYGAFVPAAIGPVTVDVTTLVRQWVEGVHPNDGLMFISEANDKETSYTSKEWATASERPQLYVRTAVLPAMRVATGSYLGNDSGPRPFTNLGFTPDLVLIKANNNTATVAKTSTMYGDAVKELGPGSSLLTDHILSLDADGFTIGAGAGVNQSGIQFFWVAFRAAPGEMIVGSYLGDGADDRDLTGLGFQPDHLIVMAESGQKAMQRYAAQTGDASREFEKSDPKTDRIQTFLPDGFQVGGHNTVNDNKIQYHYVAWNATPGYIESNSYNGNNNDDRNVLSVGFQSDYILLTVDDNSYESVHRMGSMSGDLTLRVNTGTVLGNQIQAFLPDGFQIGDHPGVNDPSKTYLWTAYHDHQIVDADLEITLSVDDSLPNENDSIDFALTLRNAGPAGAAGVEVTDLLPAGLTYATHISTQGPYDQLTGIWSVGDLADAGTAGLVITATIDPGTAGSTLVNEGKITAGGDTDPDQTDNDASVNIHVQGVDVEVTKWVNQPSPNEGDSVSYHLVLTNAGPDTASGVEVMDRLPAGMTYLSDSPTQGGYTDATGRWSVGTIAVGDTARLTIWAGVNPGTAGRVITNLALVTSVDQTDVEAANDTASVDIVVQSADLALSKTVDNPTPAESDLVTFTVTLTNTGPDEATGVEVTDFVPAGLTYSGHSTSQGSYNDVAGIWDVGSVALANTVTLTLEATVDVDTRGWTISNLAAVTASDQADPDAVDNSAFAKLTVQGNAFRMATGTYAGNGAGTRPITGAGFQPDVVILEGDDGVAATVKCASMPGTSSKELGWQRPMYINVITSLDADGFTVSPDGWMNRAGNDYYWVAFQSAPGDMVAGSYSGNGADNRVVGGLGFTPGYVMILPAWDNEACQRFPAQTGDASLTFGYSAVTPNLIQSYFADGFEVGSDSLVNAPGIDYHYVAWREIPGVTTGSTYSGNGADNRDFTGLGFQPQYLMVKRDGVNSTIHKPASLSSDAALSTRLGSVLPNLIQALQLDGFQLGSGTAVNEAPADYYWMAFRDATLPEADVELALSVSDTVPIEGDTLTYTITVRNAGPDGASGVQLIDLLPSGVTYLSDSPSQGAYTAATGLWDVGTILAADSAAIDLLAAVDIGTVDSTIVNGATVIAANQVDPDTTNNTATVPLTVGPSAFRVVSGSYIGSGVGGQVITGVGFEPDIVLIKGDNGETPVIRTSTMTGDNSKPIGVDSGVLPNQIRSLDADGFTVGGSNRVNQTGVSFYWTAFRGARPELVVGSYEGDGTDDRSIDVGFEPEYVIVMNETAQDAVQRFADQLGDASLLFSSAGPLSDRIQAFEPVGFQVGQHASTNANGDTLHYIASKAIPNRSEGGVYLGDGTDDRDIDGNSFNPNFVLIQRNELGSAGVFRTIAVAGDTSLPMAPEPLFIDRIQSILPDGFQIGTSPEVNDSASTYFWSAFKDNEFLDVAVTMSVDETAPNVGDVVQFTITVLDNGPEDASNVKIRDALPVGLTYDSNTPSQGTYAAVDGVWTVGNLLSSESATLQLRASVDAGTAGSVIVNNATLWLVDQTDIVAGNNSDAASVTVKSADLIVDVTVNESYPSVGDTIVYTITISNSGPDGATGILVVDSLPLGVTYLSDGASQGVYDTTSGTWAVGSVANGEVDTLLIYGQIETGTIGTYITNRVYVAGSGVADPDGGNNVDSVSVLVPTPVALDDTPGSLFPVDAFVGEPDLALRIGVDNPWDVGVALDTVSTISFTDGIRIYAAALANISYIPPHAENFILSFEQYPVPTALAADTNYNLSMELTGVTGESRPYVQVISTAGTNTLFIDQPKMSVDASLVGDVAVNPGQTELPLLVLVFDNHYSSVRTLDSLTVTNAASGPGTPAQLDAQTRSLSLYHDVDGSLSLTVPDTLLATSAFAGGRATFGPADPWTVPALSAEAVVVTANIDSTAARDGDLMDAWITSDTDIVFAESTVFDSEISPLYPLDSYGSAIIDGMVSHQVRLVPVAGDTLYSGADDAMVLTVVLPQNGYEADTLHALNVKDFSGGGGFDPADIDRLILYADNGDGMFDPVLDLQLGEMVYSGDRFEISGLSQPTGPGVVFFVTADMDIAPGNGNTFRPGIPVGGVTVVSGNDGPLDTDVVFGSTFTVVRVEKIDVTAFTLADTDRPAPGEQDFTLLRFEVRNNTLSTVTVDSLRLANTTAGPGSQADLDREINGVQLYIDDGNGRVDAWDAAVAYDLSFTSGWLTAGYIGRALAPGEAIQLLVACDVDSNCARDGDDLKVSLTSAAALYFDTALPVAGAFPFETDVVRPVNGMMPFQITVYPTADGTAITETADVLVLDLDIPSNGYAADTLTSLRVKNFGSADDQFIERVNLWADGGNGTFDKGMGDDLWLETLVSLGARQYQRSGLSHPLTRTCPAKNRIFVSCDLLSDYKFSATVQFGVSENDIGVASGNDGPRGADVIDPSVGIIPKPDEVTVFPYAVGDKRVYPGSKNVLNYGIGLYNGFRNSITLDEVWLLLNGTADHTDITIVKAFADSDTNGLFNPSMDKEIASAVSKDLGFQLSSLDLTLPSEKITYLFVAYDLGMAVSDSIIIDFHVPTASELFFIPSVDTNLSGEFNDSPGKDVTDGMIADQIVLDPAPGDRAAPGDPLVLAMGLTIPANGSLPDQLNYITIVNAGSAVAVLDIEHLNLWADGGNGDYDEGAFDDVLLATLQWSGVGWSNPAPLGETIPAAGLTCYVTFSAAASANNDRTFQAVLPVGGVEVSSSNDGPLDRAIENPNLQTMSTDPLITTLTTDRNTYSTGQEIVLSMRVRNEDVVPLLAVTAPAPTLNRAGAAAYIGGPVPSMVDLSSGADTTLVWRYSAMTAGDLEFSGFAHNGDSSEVSLETYSPTAEIRDKPTEISMTLGDVSPIAVNRGQNNVGAIELDLAYSNFTPTSSPAEFNGIELTVQTGIGTPIAPNSVLGEIAIVSSTGRNQPFALADSTANPLRLHLTDPIVIAPGDSVRLELNMDIAAGAALSPFRLSIVSDSGVNVVDANDDLPVPLATGAAFPWVTSTIDVDVSADSLLVSAGVAATFYVNTGQEAVDAFVFTMRNNGPPQSAGEVVSSVTLSFQDTTGAPIAPNDVIRNLSLSSGGSDLFYTDAIPSVGSELECDLSGVLLLPPQLPRDVAVYVDLRDFPQHDGFYISIAGPIEIVARDNNDGRFVAIAAEPPETFPVTSNTMVFQRPASGLLAGHSSLVPSDILPSTINIPVMDLVFSHADSLASSIEIDSLAMAFVDRSGNPLYPGNYFSQLCITHGADTLAVLTSLSSSDHITGIRLAGSVMLDPSSTETFRLILASKGVYTPAEFQIRIDRDHVVARDANTGGRILAISGAFPLFSDASRLQLVGDDVTCGLVSQLPSNVTGDETSLDAFDFIVRNNNPIGYTPSTLKRLTVGVQDWKGAALDPARLVSGAALMLGDTVLASAVVGPAGIVFTLPDGSVVTAPGTADTVSITVDLDVADDETFRLIVADTTDVDMRDAVTDQPIAAATTGDTGYPLATTLTHVLGVSQDAAFTNYPNPFAAGRQSTRITFYLDETARVTLKLYTVWGAPVKTLINGEDRQPGLHQDVTWTGLNGDGDVVNNGVYYLVLDVEVPGRSAQSIKRKVGVVR
jgi:uncharacterized repeat protein (TIGR01451 family)